MARPLLFLATLLTVAACDAESETRKDAVQAVEAAPAVPLDAAGASATIQAETDDDLQWAASVVELTMLENQGQSTVKLFGTAGGDPAMNGLYTYIAFFQGPADGWKVFRIGDFLDYRLLRDGPGRVDLEVEESVMDPATSEISSRKRRIIVGFSAGAEAAAPAVVTLTPAA